MNMLTWQPQYELGHGEIDQQHQNLLSLLRQLHGAIAPPTDLNHGQTILQEIVEETLNHFRAEEKLMGASNYPGYLGHRAAHQNLERDLEKVVSIVSTDATNFTLETVALLGKLILNHICEEDRPMVDFLNAPDTATASENTLTAATFF